MVNIQIIKSPNGEELVALSRNEFDRVAAGAEGEEDKADVAAYGAA